MKRILIKAGSIHIGGELNETVTARAIWEALPLEASGNRWGEEIYFRIPVVQPLEPSAQEVVRMGDLGYWPTGQAFCIFFGPTPISGPGEIRPASAVTIIGGLLGDPKRLSTVPPGAMMRLEKADSP